MEHWNFWHGSQRWEGRPNVRSCRANCYEHGPGLYLTTSKAEAKKYAKGAGSLVKLEVSSALNFLENVSFSLEQLETILPYLRHRSKVLKDIKEWLPEFLDNRLPGTYFLNSCIDHQALLGKAGPDVAAWLVEQGVDASIYHRSTQEDWLILFNPHKIISHRKVTMKLADGMEEDFALIKSQQCLNENPPKRLRTRI